MIPFACFGVFFVAFALTEIRAPGEQATKQRDLVRRRRIIGDWRVHKERWLIGKPDRRQLLLKCSERDFKLNPLSIQGCQALPNTSDFLFSFFLVYQSTKSMPAANTSPISIAQIIVKLKVASMERAPCRTCCHRRRTRTGRHRSRKDLRPRINESKGATQRTTAHKFASLRPRPKTGGGMLANSMPWMIDTSAAI